MYVGCEDRDPMYMGCEDREPMYMGCEAENRCTCVVRLDNRRT